MAKRIEPKYEAEQAGHGPSVEAVLAVDIDINTLGSTEDFVIRDSLKGFSIISVQVVWSGLTGTLDGTVDLIQSNDSETFDEMGVGTTLSTAASSATIERLNFGGKFAGLRFVKTGITGGTLSAIMIVKRK